MYLCMCLTNEPKAQKPILRAGMYLGSGSILALYAHLRRKKPWRKSWATISTKLLLLPCSSNGVAKIYHGLWLFKSSFDWNLLTVRGWGSLLPVIGKSPVTAQLHLLLESDHNKLSTFGDRLDHRCPALHSQNRLPGCSAVAPSPLNSALAPFKGNTCATLPLSYSALHYTALALCTAELHLRLLLLLPGMKISDVEIQQHLWWEVQPSIYLGTKHFMFSFHELVVLNLPLPFGWESRQLVEINLNL